MEIGFIGLGKMGLNMVSRLLQNNHQVIAFAQHAASINNAVKKGAVGAYSLEELIAKLRTPRTIWLMVPAGSTTKDLIEKLSKLLNKDDTIIDGGNSFYKDSVKRGIELKKAGIDFLDIGTSGGTWGITDGYCLMVGGEKNSYKRIEPILEALASKNSYAHIGQNGAGHFTKMVHNGIEYALLQAYAEGFAIIKSNKEFSINLEKLTHLWNHGSIIRSWLLELTEKAFNKDPNLDTIKDFVEDSGEGRWTIATAIEEEVPIPNITSALFERFNSRLSESFSAKLIAALRKEFGGHATKEKKGQ